MTVLAVACAACLVAAVLPWMGAPGARLRPVVERRAQVARAPASGPEPVDVVVLLALVDAALASGASLPRALAAVGRAVGGPDGQGLVRASSALVLGAGWDAAWVGASARLRVVSGCLRSTWTTGAAPGPALRTVAKALVRDRRSAAREAAGRLGVRLVLPLGLCFLPAFVLVGLVPVLVSVGGQVVG